MITRVFKEFDYQTLILPLQQDDSLTASGFTTTLTFHEIMKNYDEKFIAIEQGPKPFFLDIKLTDLIKIFSIPVCTRADGRSICSRECKCLNSMEIGMQLYEKGSIHCFHQMGQFLIGSIVEQQTDPLSKIAIEFDSQMRQIKSIHCPCRLSFCPHAFALIYFRMKVKAFYAIKLPTELFLHPIPQIELLKTYGFIMHEARQLPMIRDYHSRVMTSEQLTTQLLTNQQQLQTPFIYIYCHKNILPLDSTIVEEQARARRWISDLFMKRNSQQQQQQQQQCNMAPIASAGDLFSEQFQQHLQQQQQQQQINKQKF